MTQHLRPTSTITAGTWLASTTTLHGDTDEGVDMPDDEMTTASTDTNASDMELRLAAGNDPGTGLAHAIFWRARRGGAFFLDALISVRLYEGATLRATAPSTYHGSTWSTGLYLLSVAEADAITDYSNLRLRVQLVDNIGGNATLRVTALELTMPSIAVYVSKRAEVIAPRALGMIASPAARGTVYAATVRGVGMVTQVRGPGTVTAPTGLGMLKAS